MFLLLVCGPVAHQMTHSLLFILITTAMNPFSLRTSQTGQVKAIVNLAHLLEPLCRTASWTLARF